MKVLVTGATGWLGGRFIEILLENKNDWEINCLIFPGENTSFLEKLDKKINFFYADIRKEDDLKGIFKEIDIVFHTAGLIHPKKISDLYKVNTLGTLNLATEAYNSGVKRFIYISSNSVSGVNLKKHELLNEKMEPRPYLNYGKSKYLAELIVNSFNEDNKMETVILRPCWFYGPNQPERQTTFFNMIKKGNPLIFGNGLNFRSMSYVDNTCQAMMLAAEKKEATGQTYWISDSRPYTTLEIYRTVADILGVKKFKPRFLPDLVSSIFYIADVFLQAIGLYIKEFHVAGEMNKDIACTNKKAIKELGYNPQIGLKEGMKRSVEWCKKRNLI